MDVGGEELVERQPLDAGVKVAVHGQDLRAAWATQRPWGVPGAERDLCQNDTLHARPGADVGNGVCRGRSRSSGRRAWVTPPWALPQ